MHRLTTGIAADLWRKGDTSQVWLFEQAASGAVFAYGYSESGNDLESLYSPRKPSGSRVASAFLATSISAR